MFLVHFLHKLWSSAFFTFQVFRIRIWHFVIRSRILEYRANLHRLLFWKNIYHLIVYLVSEIEGVLSCTNHSLITCWHPVKGYWVQFSASWKQDDLHFLTWPSMSSKQVFSMHGSIKSPSMGSSMDVGSAAFGEKKVLNRIKVKFALKRLIWREISSESKKVKFR